MHRIWYPLKDKKCNFLHTLPEGSWSQDTTAPHISSFTEPSCRWELSTPSFHLERSLADLERQAPVWPSCIRAWAAHCGPANRKVNPTFWMSKATQLHQRPTFDDCSHVKQVVIRKISTAHYLFLCPCLRTKVRVTDQARPQLSNLRPHTSSYTPPLAKSIQAFITDGVW